MSHNTSDSAFRCSIQRICERIDTPRSRVLASAVVSNEYPPGEQLDYATADTVSFAEAYMLSKLLSKYKGWKAKDVSAREAAVNGWYAVEAQNEKTNRRIRNLMRGTGYPGSDLITVISTAQRHISELLGSFDLKKVLRSCRWGPGATEDLPRGTKRDKKMTRHMSTTREALPFMKIIIESDPNWLEAITGYYPVGPVSLVKSFWKVVESSRFATVPKKWDIDRIIDIQPTANGYLQTGVGQYLRRRLLRYGIDLNSQEYNQNAAREGVRKGNATVDLQNASDSISLELCTLLLPWDWMQYITSLRTNSTKGHGLEKPHRLQKISSMGNGFTFELETIVFYAITRAVCELEQLPWEEVLVYGDDIICPNQAYDKLVYVFDYFGFTINSEKSFYSGEFRESCGRHFFRDVEVTPIYQKDLVSSPEEAIRFHNRLVRWSLRTYGDPWRFEESLTIMVDFYCSFWGNGSLRVDRIPKIPLSHVGDEGFLCPPEEFEVDQNGGCFTTVFRRSQQRAPDRRIEEAYLALKLSPGMSWDVVDAPRNRSIFYFLGLSTVNAGPRGHVYEDTGKGRYKAKRTYIYSVT